MKIPCIVMLAGIVLSLSSCGFRNFAKKNSQVVGDARGEIRQAIDTSASLRSSGEEILARSASVRSSVPTDVESQIAGDLAVIDTESTSVIKDSESVRSLSASLKDLEKQRDSWKKKASKEYVLFSWAMMIGASLGVIAMIFGFYLKGI